VHVPAVRARLSLSIGQQVGKRRHHVRLALVYSVDVTGTSIMWRHGNLPSSQVNNQQCPLNFYTLVEIKRRRKPENDVVLMS
jgi:hypothetical protein